jgi:hypothetical protein
MTLITRDSNMAASSGGARQDLESRDIYLQGQGRVPREIFQCRNRLPVNELCGY